MHILCGVLIERVTQILNEKAETFVELNFRKKKLQLIHVNGAAELNCTLARLLISITKVLNNKIFAARFHPNQANYLYFSNKLA